MLSLEERGFYITAVSLVYVAGGPITRAALRGSCPGSTQTFNRLLSRLIDLGKLQMVDGAIDQDRCERELAAAAKRIQTSRERKNGGKNGGKSPEKPAHFPDISEVVSETNSNKNNELEEPAGFPTRARQSTKVYQATNSKVLESEGELGRSAPSKRDAPEASRTPIAPNGHDTAERRDAGERDALTAEERAERLAKLGEVLAAINGGMPAPNGVHDQAAYTQAVTENKRDAWLNALHAWAGERLAGEHRMQAWETIHAAKAAGSRDATPKHVRRLLDDIDKLYRDEQARMSGGE